MKNLLKKLGIFIFRGRQEEYDDSEEIENPEDFGHYEYNEPLFIIDTKKKKEEK